VYPDPDLLKPDLKKQIVLNFFGLDKNCYLDHHKKDFQAQEKATRVILAFLDWDRRNIDPDTHYASKNVIRVERWDQ